MFKNYLKVAYRNLVRNKLYTVISLVGLSVGIACCLLIFLYVQDELSYDNFHAKGDHIYRMIRMEQEPGKPLEGSVSGSTLLGPEMKKNFPEIVHAVRLVNSQFTVLLGDQTFSQNFAFVDPAFFSVFTFPVLQGDSTSLLAGPGEVVITSEIAEKFFGDEDPMGQTLTVLMNEEKLNIMVAGVVRTPPGNSSVQFDLLVSTDMMKNAFPPFYLDTWDIVFVETYIELDATVDPVAFEEKLALYTDRLFAEDLEQGFRTYYQLQNITDIHLNPNYDGFVASSNPLYSYVLGSIAFAVLCIACINFMTLTIGRSSARIREVGLRKVLGAQRRQLMRQYWGEALFLVVFALLVGLVLTELFLPTFNHLAEKRLELQPLTDSIFLLAAFVLVLLTAFIAGGYPALILSRLYPVDAFRGKARLGGKNRLVQSLVVLQFGISVFLIVTTLVISSQIKYVSQYDLGFDSEQVVTFPLGTTGKEASDLVNRYRNALEGNPSVLHVAGYAYEFGTSWLYMNPTEEGVRVLIGEDITGPPYSETSTSEESYFYVQWIDAGFIPALGINVVEGRNYQRDDPADRSGGLIVNQALAKKFGWDDPIGQALPKSPRGLRDTRVIGVVEDFHFYPLHRKIQPLIMPISRDDYLSSITTAAVRISGDDIPATLTLLEETWREVSNGMPFEYRFLDDRVTEQYQAEIRWQTIVKYASFLAFLVACLGLFGLTSLAVAKRTKEVGIRKVVGASAASIVLLFTGSFLKLIVIANVIAWPVGYLVMKRWLADFAYQMNFGVGLFLLAGAITVAIGILTIIYQAVRVALVNPVDSIRYE